MLKTKNEIIKWLSDMYINQYTINADLTVDVIGDVDLARKNLTEIPIQFGKVNGSFWCASNQLTSLKGSPYEVTVNFHCALNNLTSLEYAPKKIGSYLNCNLNPITSLEGLDNDISLWRFAHSYSSSHPLKIKELEAYYEKDQYDDAFTTVDISGHEFNKAMNYIKLQKELPQSKLKEQKIKI